MNNKIYADPSFISEKGLASFVKSQSFSSSTELLVLSSVFKRLRLIYKFT